MTQRGQTIAGWILIAALAAFFIADGLVALLLPQNLAEAMAETGFTMASAPLIGVIAISGSLLLLVPRTAVIGAIVLTGFVGGAICAHVRILPAMTGHQAFLIMLGVATWAGLWLRDRRLRQLLPLSS